MRRLLNRRQATLSLLVILGILLTACSSGADEPPPTEPPPPTAVPPTVAPPTEPPPTATAQPTAEPTEEPTPEPTPEPDLTAGFERFESSEANVAIEFPPDWVFESLFGFVTFASNEELLGGTEEEIDGAVALLLTSDTSEMETTDPDEAIELFIQEMSLGENIETVDGPNVLEVNGLQAVSSTIETMSDDGVEITAFVGIVIGEARSAIFFGATPLETGADYLPTFRAMFETIELSQEVVEAPLMSGLMIPLNADGTARGTISSPNETLSFVYEGSAGDIVQVVVEPLDDELDVVIDLLDAEQNSLIGGEQDLAFGEEVLEQVVLPTDGSYTIAVRSYDDNVGDVAVELLQVSAAPDGELAVLGSVGSADLSSGTATAAFSATAGDRIDITVAPIEDGFDVVVDVLDAQGNSILPEGEVDRSFDTEYIRVLEIPATGYYTLAISGFNGQAGTAEYLVTFSNGGLPGSIISGSDELITADEAHAFPFEGVAGDVVSLVIAPELVEFDVVVGVYDEETDSLIDEIDNSTGLEEFIFEIPETGAYYFEVTSVDAASSGVYEFLFMGPETTTLELAAGDEVFGAFGSSDRLEYYYNGVAGETLFVAATSTDDTDLVIRIYDFNENLLAEVDDVIFDEPEALEITFEADDLYIIEVESFFGGGTFEMLVESN